MGDRDAWTRELTRKISSPHKYHARPVVVDGIRFASTREAARYGELVLLQRAGEISALDVHPAFSIRVVPLTRPACDPIYCGSYTADFQYCDRDGHTVIEDVKSAPTKTTAYRLRKRLVEAIHGITIREV